MGDSVWTDALRMVKQENIPAQVWYSVPKAGHDAQTHAFIGRFDRIATVLLC